MKLVRVSLAALAAVTMMFSSAGVSNAAPMNADQQDHQPERPSALPERVTGSRAAPKPATRPAPRTTGWPKMRSDADMIWDAMALPTGDARTSAIGIEKGMPREVRLGAPFEYQLLVTNLSSLDLDNVVVTDKVDPNFKLSGSTPKGNAGANGVYTWDLGTLAPGESKLIKVQGTATSVGTVCSCANVTWTTALCSCVNVVQPALKLVKTGPAEVLKCDPIEYTFVVSNTGTGSVQNVKINDSLPAGLTTRSGSNSLSIDVGTLAPGQSKRYNATVNASRTGRFVNKATAVGEGGVSANSGDVATVVRQPVLAIDKTCPTKEFIGRNLDYTITVRNTGDGVAANTVIEDQLPSGASFVSASDGGRLVGNKVVWNVGNLAANGSKRVTMRLKAGGAGTYTNTARATAACADAVSDSCSTEITGIPAILLEVIDIEDPVQVGGNETYVITVTNQGSAPDTNIRIVCTLESNQEYVSSSGAVRGTAQGRTVTFDPIPSLAPGQKATMRVVVKNVKTGDVRFSVTMNSDQLTRPVAENEATNIYE